MDMASFSFCPNCGQKTLSYLHQKHWKCSSCGFDLYNNVASAVALIIEYNKKILMLVRGKNPCKGLLALPGGFVDPQESAEEAAKRECREEIGIIPSNLHFFCTFPNIYDYKGITYNTCDMFFTATFGNSEDSTYFATESEFLASLTPQENEVSSFYLLDRAKIAQAPIAFPSIKNALLLYNEITKIP